MQRSTSRCCPACLDLPARGLLQLAAAAVHVDPSMDCSGSGVLYLPYFFGECAGRTLLAGWLAGCLADLSIPSSA